MEQEISSKHKWNANYHYLNLERYYCSHIKGRHICMQYVTLFDTVQERIGAILSIRVKGGNDVMPPYYDG